MALPACLSSEGARVGRAPQLIRLGGRGRLWDKRVRNFQEGAIQETRSTPAVQILAVSCFYNLSSLSRVLMAMTNRPSLHDNIAGVGQLPGPQSAVLALSKRFSLKHPNSGKAEKSTVHWGHQTSNARSCRVVHPQNLTFLYLLNLTVLVREGQKGGQGLRVRGVQKRERRIGSVECHKATAVQGCLSLQGNTPLLSW